MDTNGEYVLHEILYLYENFIDNCNVLRFLPIQL